MAPKKTETKRPAQEERESTPTSEENVDALAAFINSLPAEHQEDVQAAVETVNLSIDTILEYLEEYLTVGQSKICRRLLEEQCSNFNQYLTKPQAKLVAKMLTKGAFDDIRKMIHDNPPALEAFQNYLKYNGHEKNESEDEEETEGEEEVPKESKKSKDKGDKKKGSKNTKKRVETSEDEGSAEENETDSEDDSEEEKPAPKPTKKNKNKKPKDNVPTNMDYEEWVRHSQSSAARGQIPPTPLTIWDMAEKAAAEISELKTKVTAQENEIDRLKMELQSIEQLRKSERDELNRYNEQKLQEASKNYLEELKQQEQRLKDQHARELAKSKQQDSLLTPVAE